MDSRHKRIATLELAIGFLQEAAERLQRLCPQLQNQEHGLECTETAKNIWSQVTVIRTEISYLRAEL